VNNVTINRAKTDNVYLRTEGIQVTKFAKENDNDNGLQVGGTSTCRNKKDGKWYGEKRRLCVLGAES